MPKHYAVWLDDEGVHLITGETEDDVTYELPEAVGGAVMLATAPDAVACLTSAIYELKQAVAGLTDECERRKVAAATAAPVGRLGEWPTDE